MNPVDKKTPEDLRAVNLRGADLRGCRLGGSNLTRADLSDADLSPLTLGQGRSTPASLALSWEKRRHRTTQSQCKSNSAPTSS